jgi:geranylgeranyl pyrophosphate synthase
MVLALSYALNVIKPTDVLLPNSFEAESCEVPSLLTINNLTTSVPETMKRQLFASPLQRRLAEITEMIHTASLFHDDVIDKASTRRNVSTVNQVFGNKLAILGGDFLLSRASVSLARLRSLEVCTLAFCWHSSFCCLSFAF